MYCTCIYTHVYSVHLYHVYIQTYNTYIYISYNQHEPSSIVYIYICLHYVLCMNHPVKYMVSGLDEGRNESVLNTLKLKGENEWLL